MSRFGIAAVPRILSRIVGLGGLALVLLAFGSSETNQARTGTGDAVSASSDTIEVTMTDYAYQPPSITVPAGKQVTLTFTNEGSVEHYFVVGDTIASDQDGFRQNLFSGVSLEKNKQTDEHEEEEQEEGEEHEEEEEHHENEFELPPGGSGSLTFTLPPSKAGTYTIACFESTGGKKHYEMGMKGTLTVTADAEN